MSFTFDYILYCQSPALFLLAVILLLKFCANIRSHKFRASMNLTFSILSLLGGLILYYLGMLYEYFTIRDFWHIRFPGWIGIIVVTFLFLILLYHSIMKRIKHWQSEKSAQKAETARQKELEDIKNAAYATGKADAEAAATASACKPESNNINNN